MKNIVIMAGDVCDPAEWEIARELLQSNGYNVTIVERKPMTFEESFRSTILALECNEGAAIFVGHSWNKNNLNIDTLNVGSITSV
jgi:hypothetical protein